MGDAREKHDGLAAHGAGVRGARVRETGEVGLGDCANQTRRHNGCVRPRRRAFHPPRGYSVLMRMWRHVTVLPGYAWMPMQPGARPRSVSVL